MPKYSIEDLKRLRPEDIEVSEAGPRTAALALLSLTIAQTYLLELVRANQGDEKISQSFEHVAEAIKILDDSDTINATEH